MAMEIREIEAEEDFRKWDAYVVKHAGAMLYHLSGWKKVIEKTYRHKGHYFIALENRKDGAQRVLTNGKNTQYPYQCQEEGQSLRARVDENSSVVGVLPLVHMKNFLFGNALVSIPFFDSGGILSEDNEVAAKLLTAALELKAKLRAEFIELRHAEPVPSPRHERSAREIPGEALRSLSVPHGLRAHKMRMLLDLPGSSRELLGSFRSKLRSQIKRGVKEGLETKVGGEDLLADFYKVFSENMRDLGSPVHSMGMMKNVLAEFADMARIIMVYAERKPVACGMIIGFKDVMENPWASSLRRYSRQSPNMLLYWAMLEYSCERGFKLFDFGRSSPDEGTYRFKEQWGAKASPLQWYYVGRGVSGHVAEESEKEKFRKVMTCWQNMPVGLTRFFGPRIRRHISL
jgi:serine/alanine adding enzyme